MSACLLLDAITRPVSPQLPCCLPLGALIACLSPSPSKPRWDNFMGKESAQACGERSEKTRHSEDSRRLKWGIRYTITITFSSHTHNSSFAWCCTPVAPAHSSVPVDVASGTHHPPHHPPHHRCLPPIRSLATASIRCQTTHFKQRFPDSPYYALAAVAIANAENTILNISRICQLGSFKHTLFQLLCLRVAASRCASGDRRSNHDHWLSHAPAPAPPCVLR